MRKKIMIAACTIVALMGVMTIYASENNPGSISDPLVTKSYVDNKIDEVINLVGSILDNQGSNENNNDNSEISDDGNSFATYNAIGPIKAGTIILGAEGTELILRGGQAVAVCPGENGLQNVTQGTDIKNGGEIPLNHLIIVPREDGRGILIEKDAYLMVRGAINYEQ